MTSLSEMWGISSFEHKLNTAEHVLSWVIPISLATATGLTHAHVNYTLTSTLATPSTKWAQLYIDLSSTFTLFGVVITWLIIVTLVHLTALLFDGEGSFVELVKFSGYGFLPLIVGGVITILSIDPILAEITARYGDSSSPDVLRQALSASETLKDVHLMNSILESLGLLWIAFAVWKMHNLTYYHAALSLVLPLTLVEFFTWVI